MPLIAELNAEFPYALCILEDSETREYPPDLAPPSFLVGASPAAVAMAVRHQQNGDATVRLFFEEEPAKNSMLAFEGNFRCESGHLRLTDVEGVQHVEADLAAGVYRLRVLVDETPEPKNVEIFLN